MTPSNTHFEAWQECSKFILRYGKTHVMEYTLFLRRNWQPILQIIGIIRLASYLILSQTECQVARTTPYITLSQQYPRYSSNRLLNVPSSLEILSNNIGPYFIKSVLWTWLYDTSVQCLIVVALHECPLYKYHLSISEN